MDLKALQQRCLSRIARQTDRQVPYTGFIVRIEPTPRGVFAFKNYDGTRPDQIVAAIGLVRGMKPIAHKYKRPVLFSDLCKPSSEGPMR